MAQKNATTVNHVATHIPVPELRPSISYEQSVNTSSLLEQRILAAERWLHEAPAQQRSIQLLSVSKNNAEVLESYLLNLSAQPGMDAKQVFVYASRLQGRSVYSVLYGQYGSHRQAKNSMELLPQKIQQQGPFLVRSVQGVKDEISSTTG